MQGRIIQYDVLRYRIIAAIQGCIIQAVEVVVAQERHRRSVCVAAWGDVATR